MGAGIWFWIIYVLVGLGFIGWGWVRVDDRRYLGGGFVFYVLLGLLAWKVFGPPIQ